MKKALSSVSSIPVQIPAPLTLIINSSNKSTVLDKIAYFYPIKGRVLTKIGRNTDSTLSLFVSIKGLVIFETGLPYLQGYLFFSIINCHLES